MDGQSAYPFEFSVVMAVYNVEPWIREAVDSLIAQDFGFEKIQLIMVDDGSTDGSGAICDEYAARYPENVVVIHKENGGASSARNAGVRVATGRYLNFLDPDDLLDLQVLSSVHKFFAAHGDETDVVSIPIMLFEAREGEHWGNDKFKNGSRVIDLEKEWQFFQMSLASAFLKSEIAKKYCFQEDLVMAMAEDAKELIKIFLRTPRLGVVVDGYYWYRQRAGSQIRTSRKKPLAYIPYLRDFSQWAIQYSTTLVSHVPKCVQFIVMYDLQWRVSSENLPIDILSAEDVDKYCELLKALLKCIDDDVVLAQQYLFQEHKTWILEQNHKTRVQLIQWENDALLVIENKALSSLAESKIYLELLEIQNGLCSIDGFVTIYPTHIQDVTVYLKINEEIYPCNQTKGKTVSFALGTPASYRLEFQTSFPLLREKEKYNIEIVVKIGDIEIKNKNLNAGRYFPVSREYRNAYYLQDGWRVSMRRDRLTILSCGRKGHIISEWKFLKELWKRNALGERKAVLARLAYHVQKLIKRRQIWLISDKAQRADDNGEVFFKYVNQQKNQAIKSYFIINKNCPDYLRMSKFGKTAGYLTWKHKNLLLLSDYIISAYSHMGITNPFANFDPYRDILADKRYIFLQHGVIYNDVSRSVGKKSRNIFRFVTSAEQEWRYIASPQFGYQENEVWLTGLPRFDRLKSTPQKRILFMPTWRMFLTNGFEPKEDRWILDDTFEESEFFQNITNLMNNKRLIDTARRLNYEIHFVPHSIFFPYIDKFRVDPQVIIHGSDCKYFEMFNSGDLLITDYSSVAFDFSYLRKPIIYWRFDEERFYKEHGYLHGYFDVQRDGFGEVEYDLESTVDRIIEYMENGCQLKDKYRERIDKFFAFNDQNNCQRVYEAILKLDKQG